MVFLIGFLTLVMVLNCVALIGLVLIQLPKKDTGGGLAFGGGASDALFGAGSGTVLTKITKYAATIFFALAIILAMLQSHYHNQGTSEFGKALEHPRQTTSGQSAPSPSAPTAAPVNPLPTTNSMTAPAGETNSAAAPTPVAPTPAGTNSPK
jgi:preprotein translocase subunit SecG